jgi:alcohol dehydrogenase
MLTPLDYDLRYWHKRLTFRSLAPVNALDSNQVETAPPHDLLGPGRPRRGAIEAVGAPATFVLCEDLVAPGGVIANTGVHGQKVDLHLERLWAQNIAITTWLVDTSTTPMLMKTVQSKKIDPTRLITHHYKLDQILDAYDTFGRAAKTGALKVIIAA